MPALGYSGPDSFTYEDKDSTTGQYSNVATVSITVQETAPLANAGSFTIADGLTLTAAISATDAEGDPLTASVASNPQDGTLKLNANGTFTYTPSVPYSGNDSFTYDVSDGLHTSTATVTLAVTETTPVVGNVYYTTGAGQPLDSNSTITPTPSVQAFDSDLGIYPLTSQVVTQPLNGTLAFGTNGTFVYTPKAGFTGLDTFSFEDSDGILCKHPGHRVDLRRHPVDYHVRVGAGNAPSAAEGSQTSSTSPFLTWTFSTGTEANYSDMVQWGDGTESPARLAMVMDGGGPVVEGPHTYTKAGTYPITVAILGDSTTNYAMAVFTNVVTAAIADQSLTATSLTFNALTSQATPLEVATFTDTDPNAKASLYTATINWDNGVASNATITADPAGGGKFDVIGTDPYTVAGTYNPVKVQITDTGDSTVAGRSTATAISTANVTANPITAANVTPNATEGTAFSGTVATFSDTESVSVASIVNAPITWGDGSTSTGR